MIGPQALCPASTGHSVQKNKKTLYTMASPICFLWPCQAQLSSAQYSVKVLFPQNAEVGSTCVGLSTDGIHGLSQSGVCLQGDGAVRHGPSAEALHNLLGWLHLAAFEISQLPAL